MKIGYKATYNGICNPNGDNTLKYEIGKTYAYNGKIELCKSGFHYCKKLKNVFKYYNLTKDIQIFKIEDLGESIEDGDKIVTNKLKVLELVDISDFVKYDENKNVIYKKGSDGEEFFYKYDENKNVIYKKKPNGNEFFYKYDENKNLIYVKHPNGDEYFWEYKYDKNNNIIYKKYPDGDESFYKYDKNNNLICQKSPKGSEFYIVIS